MTRPGEGLRSGLEWSLAAHIRAVSDEEVRLRLARQAFAEDPDRSLARSAMKWLRNGYARWGSLLPNRRNQLLQDRHMAIYLASVLAAGDMAVSEARRSARDINSTISQFPAWRRWGQLLEDANATDDLDGLLRETLDNR